MTHRKREIIGLRNERDFPHRAPWRAALPRGRAMDPSPAQRYSIERLRPLTHPSSRRPFSNAAARDCASGSLATRPINTPTRRIRSICCARPASGHAAAPPSRVIRPQVDCRGGATNEVGPPRAKSRSGALIPYSCGGRFN
jgi:hypothetical protein